MNEIRQIAMRNAKVRLCSALHLPPSSRRLAASGNDGGMSKLSDIAEADNWRCWLCDEVVEQGLSSNDPRGPSIDAVITKAKAKKRGDAPERLAHIACNTKKGAITPVVAWPSHLFVVDPAAIIPAVERLERKGGREAMARCTTKADAQATADWLVDRLSRLAPDLTVSTKIEPGGGQFLVVLVAA